MNLPPLLLAKYRSKAALSGAVLFLGEIRENGETFGKGAPRRAHRTLRAHGTKIRKKFFKLAKKNAVKLLFSPSGGK